MFILFIKKKKKKEFLSRIVGVYIYLFIYVPERTTISSAVNPFLAKEDIRLSRLEEGGGSSLLAPVKFAVLESFLPNGTDHDFPPN